MALLDLQGVPWRVTVTDEVTEDEPAEVYAAWAAELGVSASETLVACDGDDLATPFTLDSPLLLGTDSTAFVSSEGGIGLYQAAPGNTTSTAYDLIAQGISRMYGLGTRPNLLLSCHYQSNLKLQNGKLQKRYGVTIFYAELVLSGGSIVRLRVALRLEPGLIRIATQTIAYAFPWILTELDPATDAVVQSELIYDQPSSTYATLNLALSGGVGLLASPAGHGQPAMMGDVGTCGHLRSAGTPCAWVGAVATSGVMRASPWASPALVGTVFSPVVADHATAWKVVGLVGQSWAGAWGNAVPVSRPHQAAWALRVEAASSAAWLIPLRPAQHRLAWGEFGRVGARHEVRYGNHPLVGATLDGRWGDLTFSDRALRHPWGDLTPVVAEHAVSWEVAGFRGARLESPWSDRPAATTENVLFWGDGIPPRAALSAPWGNRPQAGRTLLTAWGDGEFPRAAFVAPWGQLRVHRVAHLATWTTPVPVRAERATPWADSAWVRVDLAAGWADLAPLLPVPHQARWSNRPGASRALVTAWGEGVTLRPEHAALWTGRPVVREDLVSGWGQPPACRQSSEAGWADTVTAPASHRLVWADQGAGRGSHLAAWTEALPAHQDHAAPWADARSASQALESSWADAIPSRRDLGATWTDATPSRLTHAAVYADREAAKAGLTVPWGPMTPASRTQVAPWALTAPGRRACTLVWSLNERPAAAASHRVNWAVLEDVNLISIDNVPEVLWQGQSVPILAARLSADEESPVWIAEEIVIADRELWSAIQLGDLIQFSIHEETWLLRVDGKGMSRPQPGDMLLSISAVSPLAWLDAPYASAITLDNASEAVSARATVAALVAPVGTLTWDLDDWLIPPGALAMSETTPLQAAREIVAAIGGLLESAPDGTPVARRRHPVTMPSYGTATPDQVIQDGDLFAFRVASSPFAGFNRVVITNEDLNGEDARDRLEYFDEDANPYDGEMRAWPNPWRPAVLGHTGHPDTEITALGERQHSHTELVEFVAGRGQVQYPVHTLTSVQWQHVDLGSLAADGTELTATVSEQSLAWVTYTTRTLDWRIGLERDESVQFVLI